MVKQYRKRPVVITAEQFLPRQGQVPEGVDWYENNSGAIHAYLDTLEGRMKVKEGSFIITGIRGEKYACEESIFNDTYEEYCQEHSGDCQPR